MEVGKVLQNKDSEGRKLQGFAEAGKACHISRMARPHFYCSLFFSQKKNHAVDKSE
jgi:hypothetical protein